jgi:pimeloyl-ACP methyl ester carboxylesterase
LAPDLRGRGASASVPGPFGLARHAEDVLTIADTLGIESSTLVGESMGAFVVAIAAARRPELARSVVLVDGGLPLVLPVGIDADAVLEATLGPVLDRLRQTFPSVKTYLDFWRKHPAMASTWNEDVEAYLRYDLTGEPPAMRPAASEEAVRADARDLFGTGETEVALRSLTCPVVHLRAERGLDDLPPGFPAGRARRGVEIADPRLQRPVRRGHEPLLDRIRRQRRTPDRPLHQALAETTGSVSGVVDELSGRCRLSVAGGPWAAFALALVRIGVHERLVDSEQCPALARRERRVRLDGRRHPGWHGFVVHGDAGQLIEVVGVHLQRSRDRGDDSLGRCPKPTLDLRQVRVRDPRQLGESSQW